MSDRTESVDAAGPSGQFDPDSGERTVIREAEPLATDDAGIEIVERDSARTEIRVATAAEKARARRRVAERAYGKGWRSFDLPDCARAVPDDDGLPYCPYKERVVRPATDCGPVCDGHDPTDPPDQTVDSLRAARTPWEPDPAGRKRRQSGLDRYVDDLFEPTNDSMVSE
mgnify:CR=1 FL=1